MFNNASKKQPWIPLSAILMFTLAASDCTGKVSPEKVEEMANPTPTVAEQEAKLAATQNPTPYQTHIPELSFQNETYQDTTGGFEFYYPSNWVFEDGEQHGRGYYVQFYSWDWQPGESVETIPPGETILQVAVNSWDPENDLEAYVTQRTLSWDSSIIAFTLRTIRLTVHAGFLQASQHSVCRAGLMHP